MKWRIEVKGGEELARALAELPERVGPRVLREALRKGAMPMRDQMAADAPRGDPKAPNLHQSMAIRAVKSGDGAGVIVGPGKDAYYGFFLEYGTARMPAQPFMRPAFDSHGAEAIRITHEEAWKALTRRGIGGAP